MTVVASPNSTVAFIRTLVRELTASPGEGQLTTAYLDQSINNFYQSDFPGAIKTDQMRSVYTFFTVPYQDAYPLDINFNQSVRAPVYIDGVQGNLYKARDDFFNVWPELPSYMNGFGSDSAVGQITGATQANPCLITSPNHGLATGNLIYIYNVGGMVELNNEFFTITFVSPNSFTINVDSTLYSAFTSGGQWSQSPVTFNFIVPGPFIAGSVTIGGIDIIGNTITIADDGYGNLQTQTPNPVVSIPAQVTPIPTPAIPGMLNTNTGNPGLINVGNVGTVNYVTGAISFAYPIPLQAGTSLSLNVSQYQPGRPFAILFWNNTFRIRPIPKLVHKITVETYLTPVQFLLYNDVPIVNQWAQYIAYGVSCEILRRRQDTDGLSSVMEGFMRQESLVLERQACEEIGSRNRTVFAGSQQTVWGNSFMQGWY
ncbi:MAG: ubiquitin-activating E1 FCCH domain-containing protein [Pirellulales bacterium]